MFRKRKILKRLDELYDVSPQVRAAAAAKFAYEDPPSESLAADAIETLADAVRDADGRVRHESRLAILNITRRHRHLAAEAVPAIAEALQSDDFKEREEVAVVLELLGPDAVVAVPALTDALSDAERGVRRQAARTLVQIVPTIAAGNPAVIEILSADVRDDDGNSRAISESYLKKAGSS